MPILYQLHNILAHNSLADTACHLAAEDCYCKPNTEVKYLDNTTCMSLPLQAQQQQHINHRHTGQFLARDSIYAIARYMPSPVHLSVHLSVCPSVRHTGGSVKDV